MPNSALESRRARILEWLEEANDCDYYAEMSKAEERDAWLQLANRFRKLAATVRNAEEIRPISLPALERPRSRSVNR